MRSVSGEFSISLSDFDQSMGPSTATHADSTRLLIHAALSTPPNGPSALPFKHLALFSPQSVLSALFQELSGVIVTDREGASSLSRTSIIVISAIVTTPRGTSNLSLLPYLLEVFVPSILARHQDVTLMPNGLDILTLLVGTGVTSLRSKAQARGTIAAHMARTMSVPTTEGSIPYDVDALVHKFVQWLEASNASRTLLLQKLRLRSEFAGQFVIG